MRRKTEGKTVEKERFIELRAAGLSYDSIAAQLNVSKPTLISWGRELAKEVHNARTLRLDELFERFAVAKGKRVEAFGKRLEAILAELDTRNLADVKTEALLALALKYGESLKAEHEPLTLQGEDLPFDVSALTTRDTWPA
jgi:transposase